MRQEVALSVRLIGGRQRIRTGSEMSRDCIYFFNSSCAKGDGCTFRHSEAALGSETVCLFWKSGSCVRQDCKYRHTDAPIDRSRTLCYFESQRGGCQRPNCAFRHRSHLKKGCTDASDSSAADADAVIGTSDRKSASVSADQTSSDTASEVCDQTSPDPLTAVIPVEPVSFRILDEDESDAEDEKKQPPGKQSDPDDGIVVKSLEQIRMERIFKQETSALDVQKRSSSDSKADRSSGSAKRVRLIRPQVAQPVASERTGSPTDHLTELLDAECDPSSTAGDDSDILQEIDKIINS